MAKKGKEETELEYWRGRFKEVDKLNKSLKRRLRKLEKHQHNYEYEETTEDERNEDGLYEVKQQDTCPSCGKNELKILDLGIRKYKICTLCRYKEKIDG